MRARFSFGNSFGDFLKTGLVVLAMILNANCSAVESAIKDAAEDVGEELAEDVGEQIEDKLSSASEEIKGEISGIKDDMKAEMEAAITSLRDELSGKVTDLNTSLAALKDTLPAEVNAQLDKLVVAVQDIKGVDDLTGFFNELSELDNKMASLEESIRTEVDTAIQPLHETLNQYDIKEFQNDLDGKMAKVEELINDKSFELKDELEGQITKARESIEGLVNLRDIAFANNTLVSVTQIINQASSDEDYKNALKEITKFTGDVIEGITDVAENINVENLGEAAKDAAGALANADLGNANVDVDVDINVNQNSGNQAAAVSSPEPTPEPAAVVAAPSPSPATPAPTPNAPVPVAISAPPPVDEPEQVCEDIPSTEQYFFSDPCNPDLTDWQILNGILDLRKNGHGGFALVGGLTNNTATPFEIKNIYVDTAIPGTGFSAAPSPSTTKVVNISGSQKNVWVRSGSKVNIIGSEKVVYFETGAIINGEVMNQSKNYTWAQHCRKIEPYLENCEADLGSNYQTSKDEISSKVNPDIPNIWIRYPTTGYPSSLRSRSLGNIVLDEGSSPTGNENRGLFQYAKRIFVLPGATAKIDNAFGYGAFAYEVYLLPESKDSLYLYSSGGGASESYGVRGKATYGNLKKDKPSDFKLVFMCKNIELCRVE